MRILFDTANLKLASKELGSDHVGQLITPLTKRTNQGVVWAMDNGCFAKFNEPEWMRLLIRERDNIDRCEFVALPDVVGCAARTKALFYHFMTLETLKEYPLAYVLQDGQDVESVPWGFIDYVFVGGSTEFKLGEDARKLILMAHQRGKKVHVGRVNRPQRFQYFCELGCESCDGTGISRFTWMREDLFKPDLFAEGE